MTIRLRDVSGLRYIAVLLQHPGEKIPAVALIDAQSDRANAKTVGDTRARRTHDAELARVRTTRSIKAALRRIGAHCAPLIAHLTATIRTGTDCSYLPDPRLPVQWEFGSDGDAHVNDADHSSTRTTIRNGA